MSFRVPLCLLLLTTVLVPAGRVTASPLGSSITYQGDLEQNDSPVSGNYDFIFTLYNAGTGSAIVGTAQSVLNLPVAQGLFTATLDFGAAAFDGSALWLEIQVRPAGTGTYTTLAPRQPLTPAPYALRALNGPSGSSQWVSDGFGNITYNGDAGVTGASGHLATGKGVFLEGGSATAALVYGYDYTASKGVNLYLNSAGASVAVGAVPSPAAKLDVINDSAFGLGIQSITSGHLVNPINAAVIGFGYTGTGTFGTGATGVWGQSTDANGVYGASTNGTGVFGTSSNWDGVLGQSNGNGRTGVWGVSYNVGGYGGVFQNNAGGVALFANGLAQVKKLQILGGADLAERFEADGDIQPGTVMAIDSDSPGRVRVAEGAYLRTVAGVVSGAYDLEAGVELGTTGPESSTVALALTGRVWVKCDATRAAIRPGDLLTTADRAGHAMRADDAVNSRGAILGKAMTSLETGTGLVLVLVGLQ